MRKNIKIVNENQLAAFGTHHEKLRREGEHDFPSSERKKRHAGANGARQKRRGRLAESIRENEKDGMEE